MQLLLAIRWLLPVALCILAGAGASLNSRPGGSSIDVSAWYGRSIYFVMVDRFAKEDGDTSPQCGTRANNGDRLQIWCGGTLKGLMRKLDYIQDMGFDAVWITPVVKQAPWDFYESYGYHGYWASDWWQIDEHLGTEDDLVNLSQALHDRKMLLMLDIVLNHAGPVGTVDRLQMLGPGLNSLDGAAFHQVNRRPDQSFADYMLNPYQCIGGACNSPGIYSCEYQIEHGWFPGGLADLNQTNPDVAKYFKDWVVYMTDKYNLDGLRLDTAAFVERSFLRDFQQSAGRLILGEVASNNMTFHADFQQTLTGLLNLPIMYRVEAAFYPQGSLDRLAAGLTLQRSLPYVDEFLLGNSIDTHDGPRFEFTHTGAAHSLKNALTWMFLWHGIPILYYGTEQPAVSFFPEDQNRASMWFEPTATATPFGVSPMYEFVKKLNALRQLHGLGFNGSSVKRHAEVVSSMAGGLAFTRASLLVVVSALQEGKSLSLCLPLSKLGAEWSEACREKQILAVLSSATASCDLEKLCIQTEQGEPAVFARSAEAPSSKKAEEASLIVYP